MTKPVLLDGFCKAGGATKGYQRAGFYVVGVDIEPQPHYCGDEFIQADFFDVSLEGYDAIHVSPPCQHYSSAGKATQVTHGKSYPDLYDMVRRRLIANGRPWVIENVDAAPSKTGIVLCGSMFGLDIERHRVFETSWLVLLDRHCRHGEDVITVTGHTPQRWLRGRRRGVSIRERNEAMGIDWMTVAELVQAVPPAYTEFIGEQLLAALGVTP